MMLRKSLCIYACLGSSPVLEKGVDGRKEEKKEEEACAHYSLLCVVGSLLIVVEPAELMSTM